jgi:hypothetical protein
MMFEKIIHTYGECKCLPHEKHIDRYFSITSPFNHIQQHIQVCNSYIGLLIKEKYFKNDWRNTYDYCVESIIKEVFSWVVELERNYSIKKYHRTNSYNFITDGFWFRICEYPKISIEASYTKASEIILTGTATNDFIIHYCNGVKSYLEGRKTKVNANLFSLLYNLEKYPYRNKPLVLDIANEILNLEIKFKKAS